MVEVSQNNPANNITVKVDKRTGALDIPGKVPSQEIYSYTKGRELYNQIQQDIYEGEKKATPPQKKFPTVLKILGGIIGVTTLILCRNKIWNGIKGIFKKTPPTTP